jgi:(1->4)-alpha-D-glucan 1-alpha-D-glucosylmutase
MAVPFLATYRFQFHKDFTFKDAEAQVPYLAKLGISHLYASPILTSRAGSTHGYDGTDPSVIDPKLGGEDGFRSLAEACRAAGLGVIIDIVPNHLAVDSTNPLWMEALEFGASGPAGAVFDIDWAKGPVIIPTLGQTMPAALAAGEITLKADWEQGRLLAAYFDNTWPLRPDSVAAVLQVADAADEGTLHGLAQRWQRLGESRTLTQAEVHAARQGLKAVGEKHRALIEAALARMDIGAILRRQHWRAVNWRAESDRLTYRRFFNITGLVGVRVEDPAVFDLIHAVPLKLLREGLIDGLRVDHVDGLADPTAYCARLRKEAGPHAILLVEKILERDEPLRPWPITGTTGYERLNDINGLFVDAAGWRALDAYLVEKRILARDQEGRLAAAKSFMLRSSFLGEVEKLTELAVAMTEHDLSGAEFGPATLREATLALLIRFTAYRSYGPDSETDPADRALWQTALDRVKAGDNPWIAEAAAYLVQKLAVVAPGSPANEYMRRFQQLSGPAMAKGLEDTEFYRSVALTSVNEVGGDLTHPWRDAAEFHAIYTERAQAKKQDLIPLATHDTKRGPDTRARINALSHHAEDWASRFETWHAMNAPLRADDAPDAIDEWLIYQTLIGTWPITTERMSEYLTKAMREAKRNSFWDNPNEAYEAAVQEFARALIEDSSASAFRTELSILVESIGPWAQIASIAATILQITLPGVPDIYQGTEFWDFSLVDPDNRRPVDYAVRRAILDHAVKPELKTDDEGSAKLIVTHRLLALRQAKKAVFEGGDYTPLDVGAGWLGFSRRSGTEMLTVAVPTRPPAGSAPILTGLGTWRDVLTGEAGQGTPRMDAAWPFIVAVTTAT